MTCIVGLIDDGDVYLGGDSAGVNTKLLSIQSRKDVKVFRVKNTYGNEFVMGYTSSFRMGQVLRFSFIPPIYLPDKDVYEYMCTDFIDAVRQLFKSKGYGKIESGEDNGGTFIVGFLSRLFYVDDDFQVGEMFDDYHAVGCGYSFALGAMMATENSEFEPTKRLEIALKAAQKFSGGVREPFTFEILEDKDGN